MTIARLAIGANLADASKKVQDAISLLSEIGRLQARSSLYLTKPWGVTDQPDFYNAAMILDVTLSVRELLTSIKSIEERLGRKPTYRWGPRIIDIDILTFGDERVDEEDLQIPHPEMMHRAFVLAPLAEIDPTYLEALAALPAEEREQVQVVPE